MDRVGLTSKLSRLGDQNGDVFCSLGSLCGTSTSISGAARDGIRGWVGLALFSAIRPFVTGVLLLFHGVSPSQGESEGGCLKKENETENSKSALSNGP